MNIYFSGIGGVAIGPLAEMALDAGHHVQGSDPEESPMTKQLTERGILINKKQQGKFLQTTHNMQPIDLFVYTAALPDNHPELEMARMLGIKTCKRDGLLKLLIEESNQKLIAIAGTHGKTTTTSMLVWTLQQLNIPVSYSIGSTLSFGPSGKYDPDAEYFVYECDEYDRNMLQFHPYLTLITSLDYDHPDTYGSPGEYLAAFKEFMTQSEKAVLWKHDGMVLGAKGEWMIPDKIALDFKLTGEHNRCNATLAQRALEHLGVAGDIHGALDTFPGADRRFEQLLHNLYSDYGHHPTEIAAVLQLASELNERIILVYQPHQNVRQHEIRTQYTDCFEKAETVYWLPTHLTREDPSLPILTADELTEHVTNIDSIYTADLDDELWEVLQHARDDGKLVVCMGAGSIDTWVREKCATRHVAKVLVIDKEGNFVLQKRDDKPGIASPGKLSGFGGTIEPSDETIRAGAIRELREETNLQFSDTDLAYFKMYRREDELNPGTPYFIFYYTLTSVDIGKLKVHEGAGIEIVNPNELGKHPLSIGTRTVIAEYTHPLL